MAATKQRTTNKAVALGSRQFSRDCSLSPCVAVLPCRHPLSESNLLWFSNGHASSAQYLRHEKLGMNQIPHLVRLDEHYSHKRDEYPCGKDFNRAVLLMSYQSVMVVRSLLSPRLLDKGSPTEIKAYFRYRLCDMSYAGLS
ncbi:hypothetical protein Fot_15806 [Forsythia ovata]|uniref:Uncharacterized protein n=1 Tax=Forsythia ovata TaxID=205694 RepID=A0ABD1WCX2_9LAMI